MSRWLIGMLIFLIGLFWSSPTAMPDEVPAHNGQVFMRVLEPDELRSGDAYGVELGMTAQYEYCWYGYQLFLCWEGLEGVEIVEDDELFVIHIAEWEYGDHCAHFANAVDLYGWRGPPQGPIWGKHIIARVYWETIAGDPWVTWDMLYRPPNRIGGFWYECLFGPREIEPLGLQQSDGTWLVQQSGEESDFLDQELAAWPERR